MALKRIYFEDATIIKDAYVNINGVEYTLIPAQTSGGKDLNKATFDELQDNIEDAIEESVAEIIESGSNSNGSWVKWSDGTMICNKFVSGTTNVTTSWGNLWEGSVSCGSYPQPFIEKPFTHATSVNGTGCLIQGFGSNQNETTFGTLYITLPSSFPNRNYAINLTAKGKWK